MGWQLWSLGGRRRGLTKFIALLDERPCLYNTKLRDYFNQDKKKALDETAAVLGITGKGGFTQPTQRDTRTHTVYKLNSHQYTT